MKISLPLAAAMAIAFTGFSAASVGPVDRIALSYPSDIAAFSAVGPVAAEANPDISTDYALAVYAMLEDTSEQAIDDPFCDTQAAMARVLGEDFGETSTAIVTDADGLEMELWSSSMAGTWTIIHRSGDGFSCVVSSGFGWTDESTAAETMRIAGLQLEGVAERVIAGADMR